MPLKPEHEEARTPSPSARSMASSQGCVGWAARPFPRGAFSVAGLQEMLLQLQGPQSPPVWIKHTAITALDVTANPKSRVQIAPLNNNK
jgi:hypothetical protein